MKTIKGMLKFMLGALMVGAILMGCVFVVLAVKGIDIGVAAGKLNQPLANWFVILSIIGYSVAASTIATLLLFSDWHKSRKQLDEEKSGYEKAKQAHEKAALMWKNDVVELLLSKTTNAKALRKAGTKDEWYVWDSQIEKWCASINPDMLPETATLELMNQISTVPDDAELVEIKYIVK